MKPQMKSRFENHLIENREIRIFLSSTFSDMDAERSALVKLFDKLKLKASQRNVALSLLDLRWGVTDEESRTGKVLSVCLNEIENSHPFFIGLLGCRYGFSPELSELSKNPDLEERYPWLREDIVQKLSITEIEMQYGVLRNKEGVDACFFIKNTPASLPDDDEKLTRLKNKIRGQQSFPQDDYHSIDDLCQKVEVMVLSLLDKYFSDMDNTRLGHERNIQRAYMNSRHRFYIPRQEDFDRLNWFLNSDERHLVVAGVSGMGKSALVANWIKNLEKAQNLPYNIIYHFVGNTFGGNGKDEVLQHLADELLDLYGVDENGRENEENLEQKVQRYLAEAVQGEGKPMLIVIDGINQISNFNQEKLLNWLPQSTRKVKYLFSTIEEDETMRTFHRRGYNVYNIGPFNDKQRRDFVVSYLESVGKHMDENQLNRILYNPENENTLVLKTLLDELICFGSYEHLNERIDLYLSAKSISDFFDRMLKRMEDDYSGVRDVLSLIALSEHGLTEDEIIAMTDIRQMDFHLFYCAFSTHIVTRNGMMFFAHQYITDAVWNRYNLHNFSTVQTSREKIIHYFMVNKTMDCERRISELAFQYYQIQDCEKLYKIILSFDAFRFFYSREEGRFLLSMYWRKVLSDKSGHYHLRDYLDLSIEKMAIKEIIYVEIGNFVQDYMSDYQTAMSFYQSYLLMIQHADCLNDDDLSTSYNNIGGVYERQGDYSKALEYYRKALSVSENAVEERGSNVAIYYNNIGGIFDVNGDYPRALDFYFKALDLCKREPDLASYYNNIGSVYVKRGDCPKALEFFSKSLNILENLFGTDNHYTAMTYVNIGHAYLCMGENSNALEYSLKSLHVFLKLFGEEHASTAFAYTNVGGVYNGIGDYSNAMENYLKALTIRKKVLGQEHPDTAVSYNNVGDVYDSLGDSAKAFEHYYHAMTIWEKTLGTEHPFTATSYSNIAGIYNGQRNYPKALEYSFKALAIREKIFGFEHPDTASSYYSIGWIYRCIGDYSKALEFQIKAKAIRVKIFGEKHPDTALSYKNIGELFALTGDYSKAISCYSKASEICTNVYGLNHRYTAKSFYILGEMFYRVGDLSNAKDSFIRALEINEIVLGVEHPDTVVLCYNLGSALVGLGEFETAIKYYQRVLLVWEKYYGLEHPNTKMVKKSIEFAKGQMNAII